MNNKLIELPDYGRLIVVSDLHGNFKDYKRYLKLWDKDDSNSHIVFIGDLIHSMDGSDGSVEIIEDALFKSREYSNYHCLLGNHEWAHIVGRDIYKAGKNLIKDFEMLVAHKKGCLEPSLTDYVNFFKRMPYFLKTSNGIFISHAGPSAHILTMDEFNAICCDDYYSSALHGFLWNRYASENNGYAMDDIDNFLKIVGCNLMVVGHTVVDLGFKIIGNQMILSSSFFTSSKSYLDIDLSKDYHDMNDLIEDIKILK